MNRQILIVVVWIVLTILCGCRMDRISRPALPPDSASDHVAGVIMHTQSAQRHVQNAIPHSDSTGRVYLGAASDEHEEVLNDAGQVRLALRTAQEQVESLNAVITRHKQEYTRLESRWFVFVGRWIERMLWIVGIGWLVLGVASILLGMGNPLGWGVKLGREIVRLVPIMNIFAWLRDWLLKQRSVKEG